MTTLRNLLLLLAAVLSLGGCLFDHPLTGAPSTNIDTRLLGVYEFSEKARKKDAQEDEKPEEKVQRVAILPRNENQYLIYYRDYSKKPVQTLTYVGWISRVDDEYFLTYRDETPGSGTFGKYGFLKFVWKWPGNFTVYLPDAAGFASAANPYQMRQTLRRLQKAGTLFPYQGTYWTKIARIWWDRKNPDPITTVPPEFETGREEKGQIL